MLFHQVPITFAQYCKYRMNCHTGISQALKRYLIEKKIVKEDVLSDH